MLKHYYGPESLKSMEPSVWEPQTQGNHMYLSLAESVSAVQSSCPQVISNSVFHFQSVLVYTINYMSITRHTSNISCQLKSNAFTVER